MAHILFITPYYPPEVTPPAIRVSETAAQLINLGHQVTVLTTFPNFPTGVVMPGYQGCRFLRERHNGIDIVRVWSYITPNKGFFRRILAQLSFGCLAPFLSMRAVGYPDVIIVESPPLFNAIAGRVLAWYKHCPFVFTVADLWPESAVQLGVLHNRSLIKLAEWLEWSTYQQASLVWAVTEGISQKIIQRGLPHHKIFVLTNGVDTQKFKPLSKELARVELGWDDQFIALYAGTHGLAQGLTTLLDAAERLQDQADIQIVLIGDGATKQDLVAQAKQRNLTNVVFLEPLPHDQMPRLLAAADVCLIPLKKLPLFEGALPSKIYEAMASARPIVLSVAGEARQLAEQKAKSAIAVEPENPEALASAILYLYKNPEEAKKLGQRGRVFVEEHFAREQLAANLDAHITTLLNKSKTSSVPVSLSQPDKPSILVHSSEQVSSHERL